MGMSLERACLELGREKRDPGRKEALEVGRVPMLDAGRWIVLREEGRDERLERGLGG